jgi:acetoin utilization deacetylase AcuC-like enzyme
MAGIESLGLDSDLIRVEPRDATTDELISAHNTTYLRELAGACEQGTAPDPDTYLTSGSLSAAIRAAGAGLAVIDALRAGAGDLGFVVVRPPGHHASANHAMGFCLLNNVAIAAAMLTEKGERVAIVDWDVHHGNGTQDIFWDDGRVLYISTHQARFYPGTGRLLDKGGPDALGSTVNIPLPAGATGDVLQRALVEVAAPVVEQFAPTWVLVSAGFDAHRDDPLADLMLSAGDFALLAREVARFAPRSGRLALFLEGGYDLGAVHHSVAATFAELLGASLQTEPATSGGRGDEVVAMARRIHIEPREDALW